MGDPDNLTDREQRFIDALRQAALSNNPNPDRIGCPDKEKLQAVAHRRVPLMDPAIDHVWKCSPCAQEVMRYRAAAGTRKRWFAPAAIAAVLVLVVAGLVMWSRSRPVEVARNGTVATTPVAPTTTATLDLRPYASTRGKDNAGPSALSVPRGRVTLKLYLPVGLEAGTYDVGVMDDQLRTLCTKTVQARFEGQVLSVEAEMDLSRYASGRYVLAVRPAGDDWRTFPITLR